MCPGDHHLIVEREDGSTTVIGLHHWVSIRVEDWESDAAFSDRLRLAEWLAERGFAAPFDEYRLREKKAEQSGQQRAAWVAACPTFLQSMLARLELNQPGLSDPQTIAAAASLCSDDERVSAVLAWFGSGVGRWSGYPSYESVAGDILLKLDPNAVVRAISSLPDSAKALDGAARLFAIARTIRPHFSEELRQRLLARTTERGDPERIEWLHGVLRK